MVEKKYRCEVDESFCSVCWQYWSLNSGLTLSQQVLCCLSHTSSPFYCGYFIDWVFLFFFFFLPRPSLGNSPILCFPNIIGMTGACHHAQLFSFEMGSHELFAWADLQSQSSQSQPPVQLGMIGMHHCTQLLVEMESRELFAQAGFEPCSSDLSLPRC
jgi:hypothetical protein